MISPAFNQSDHACRFISTDSSIIAVGANAQTGGSTTLATLQTVITIPETKIFELQHYCTGSAGATEGFGRLKNFGTDLERYSQITIEKIILQITFLNLFCISHNVFFFV